MKQQGPERVAALFWLAVGVFFAAGGVMLQPGTPRNPGPGFLPLIVAMLLIVFSLFVLGRGAGNREAGVTPVRWMRHGSLVAYVFAYGAILDLAGFLVSTFLLMLALFALFVTGEHRLRRALLYAVLTAVVGWLVFSVALKVPFPHGQLMALVAR